MYNLVSNNQANYIWRVILLCKFITGQPEVKLGPSDEDRVFEVLNNTAGQKLTLDSVIPADRLEWKLKTARGQYIYVGRCDAFDFRCQTQAPGVFNLSLKLPNAAMGVSSNLTISAAERSYNLSGSFFENGTALFGNSFLYIDVLPNVDIFHRWLSCTTDFVDLAQRVDCKMSYNTSSKPWSVNSRCDVTKVYSAMGRYKCQLMVQAVGETIALGNSVAMTTHYIDNDPYVSGYCTITSEFSVPSGNYTYSIEITPGKKNYVVRSTEISIPSSAILEHDCPTYVMEGSDVTCTCRSAQNVLGSPEGYVRWVSSGSERLSLTRVQRNSSAVKNLQCWLVWNGRIIKSVNYSIEVRPHSVTRGVGIGLGVGVSVSAIGTSVLVLVIWKRRWKLVLPCASKPSEYDVIDARMVGLVNNYEVLSVPQEETARIAQAKPESSEYDVIDAKMVGLVNSYEVLSVRQEETASMTQAKPEPSEYDVPDARMVGLVNSYEVLSVPQEETASMTQAKRAASSSHDNAALATEQSDSVEAVQATSPSTETNDYVIVIA